jgi:hypothetical protein
MRCYNAAMRALMRVFVLIASVVVLLAGIFLLAVTKGVAGGGILGWLTSDPLATSCVVVGLFGIVAEVYRLSRR